MIAIHRSDTGFHKRWVNYCERQNISYKTVDFHNSDIIEQLKGCEAAFWHHHHGSSKDLLISKPILFALEHAGIKVFPNFRTGWHFDDKVSQKYLFEALEVPHVKSEVFVSKSDAISYLKQTSFPVVFKLKRGAGSKNVQLIKDFNSGKRLVNKAFGNGFRPIDAKGFLADTFSKFLKGKNTVKQLLKAFAHLWLPFELEKSLGREKGYVYLQEFIPNNDCDIRVIVIGKKAFAIKRLVRENDFRASGSGHILYDKSEFDESTIKFAFEISKKFNSDCIAYDFVYKNKQPLLVEISYGFAAEGYDPCTGYWDEALHWYPGTFDPYGWMIEEVLKGLPSATDNSSN